MSNLQRIYVKKLFIKKMIVHNKTFFYINFSRSCIHFSLYTDSYNQQRYQKKNSKLYKKDEKYACVTRFVIKSNSYSENTETGQTYSGLWALRTNKSEWKVFRVWGFVAGNGHNVFPFNIHIQFC